MYNPATGEDEWVGRRMEKGKLTEDGAYNFDANIKLFKAGKQFPDMFGNIYEPIELEVGKTMEPEFKVVGYKIKAAASGNYIENENWKEDGMKDKYSFPLNRVSQDAFGNKMKRGVDETKI